MGNGRALSGGSSGSWLVWVRALAAACVLLVAAGLLLGSNSRRYSQNASQASASPNQTASGSLFSSSSLSRSYSRSSDTEAGRALHPGKAAFDLRGQPGSG